MTTENVSKALAALENKSSCQQTSFCEPTGFAKNGITFSHTAGLKADLEYTLRLISVMRETAALGQALQGHGRRRKGTEWSSTLTVAESEAYVKKASALLKKNGDRNSNGNVWVGSLMQSLPPTIDEIPLGLIGTTRRSPGTYNRLTSSRMS